MMKESFSSIADRRQQSQVRHDLYEIIAMTIAAVIGNVLSLNENQPTLYEYADTYFKDALEHPQWYPEMTSFETVDKGHGRIERRTYYLSSDLSGLDNTADWSGLAGFGIVRSHVTVGEIESSEIRYAMVYSSRRVASSKTRFIRRSGIIHGAMAITSSRQEA